jgi:polyferredoxin
MASMAKEPVHNISHKLSRLRILFQLVFVGIWIFPLRLFSICSPVFHCYACPLAAFACPIGVMAQFSALHLVPFFAIGTVVVAGALVGSFICGYACPFGFLQDLIGRVPTPKFHLPKWAGITRYVVLVGMVFVFPYLWGEFIGEARNPLFICNVCPAGAIEGSLPRLILPNRVKLVITSLIVIAMFVKIRPWCRLFCPLGAIFGLFNRASVIYMKADGEKCYDCGLCKKKCKYGVVPGEELSSPRCIRCMECVKFKCGVFSASTIFSRKKPEPVTEETSSASE